MWAKSRQDNGGRKKSIIQISLGKSHVYSNENMLAHLWKSW